MHSMRESAIVVPAPGATRAGKRQSTAHRITAAAQALVLEHGLDGFTMDQLADHVGVSRRTLFNYFPSKDDAVLGGPPVLDEALLETFRAGGPTGNLVDDLAAIVHATLRDSPDTREDAARARQVMLENPRLIALALQRLRETVESCMVYVEQREGAGFHRARFDVALAVVLVCFHLAIERYLDDDVETELVTLFAEMLGTARDLMTT
jgi:AcrR family transcriptional regulator